MSIDVIGLPQSRGLFFVSFDVWSCFWLVQACLSFIRIFPLFKSDHVIECFVLEIHYESTLCIFHYKFGQVLLQSGRELLSITKHVSWQYKVEQVSQSVAIFMTKWGQLLYILTIFIIKWGRHYNVGYILQSKVVQRAKDFPGDR